MLVGDTLYISGRGGVDLATMKVPADVKDEVKLMMEDYKAILALAGMTMDDLVSVTIYSPDLSLYSTFNEIYRRTSPKDSRRAHSSGRVRCCLACASRCRPSRSSDR